MQGLDGRASFTDCKLIDHALGLVEQREGRQRIYHYPVSYTHLRAHETVLDLVCRLLLEKKK